MWRGKKHRLWGCRLATRVGWQSVRGEEAKGWHPESNYLVDWQLTGCEGSRLATALPGDANGSWVHVSVAIRSEKGQRRSRWSSPHWRPTSAVLTWPPWVWNRIARAKSDTNCNLHFVVGTRIQNNVSDNQSHKHRNRLGQLYITMLKETWQRKVPSCDFIQKLSSCTVILSYISH